jgi:hypothetical protein
LAQFPETRTDAIVSNEAAALPSNFIKAGAVYLSIRCRRVGWTLIVGAELKVPYDGDADGNWLGEKRGSSTE